MPLLVEAFDALDRRLAEHCQITQQKVKAHEEFTHQGRILRLFPAGSTASSEPTTAWRSISMPMP